MVTVEMPIVFVGYMGAAGAGKSTLVDKIISLNINNVQPHTYYHTQRALADGMRGALSLLMRRTTDVFKDAGVNTTAYDNVQWAELMQNPATKAPFRGLQQQFGTEVCRTLFGEDCWTALLKHRVERDYGSPYSDTPPMIRQYAPSALIVHVPDIRFENEAQFILNEGGILVRVKRPALQSTLTTAEARHSSEQDDYLFSVFWERCMTFTNIEGSTANPGMCGPAVRNFYACLEKEIDERMIAIRTKSLE